MSDKEHLESADCWCKPTVEYVPPKDYFVAEVQAAIVTTINTLGTTLIGDGFELLESSPIPDEEIAQILDGAGPLDEYRGQ
jgi:hypothetical protein